MGHGGQEGPRIRGVDVLTGVLAAVEGAGIGMGVNSLRSLGDRALGDPLDTAIMAYGPS